MKSYKLIIIILVVFFKTGNVLSEDKIFNVNNIKIINKNNKNNEEMANQAIKKGYIELTNRILLDEDKDKLSKLEFLKIKELVSYYQVTNKNEGNKDTNIIIYNIFFDKNKLHDLFYKKNISYSNIANKEIYLLPILKKDDQFFIFNQNFFYDNWNKFNENELIEFILPLENIEIIQDINLNKKNIFSIEISKIFKEYADKNLAVIFFEDQNLSKEKIFLSTQISGKKIKKNLLIERKNLDQEKFYVKIIAKVKIEIENIFKSQNLIDIRTPSFLNTKFILDKKNNLVELSKRIKKINLIENFFVQEFNNEFVFLRIKYLGNLNKIIDQLYNQKIILKSQGDNWSLEIL